MDCCFIHSPRHDLLTMAAKRKLWDWEMDDREREKAREREELEVERAVEEDLAKLNGAAMFFIKRGFSKVRTWRGMAGTVCSLV